MTEPEPGPETPDLRKSYSALQLAGSEGCPPPEALAALVTGELAGEERQRAADHVVRCRRCSETSQILFQTHASALGQSRARGVRLMRIVGVAAAAAVAVLAGRLLLAPRPEPAVERGPSLSISVAPADGANLSGAPGQFEWPSENDAESYRVKLFDDSGDLLWQSEPARETRTALPASERGLLKPGKAYFWNLEIQGRLEKRRLGPFRFRLLPN